MNSHIVGTYNLVKLSELMVKSDERSPLDVVVLSWLFHCERWSDCVTYFCGQEIESGRRVYCVLCHALDCTVPGPGSETSSECSVLE